MRSKLLPILIFLFAVYTANAQRKQIDSLYLVIRKAPDDSDKLKAYYQVGVLYNYFKPDSGIAAAQRAYDLAVSNKLGYQQRRSLNLLANLYVGIGNYTKAMKLYYDALRLAENEHDEYQEIQIHNNIGSTYVQMADYPKAFLFVREAQKELSSYLSSHTDIPLKFRKINVYILNTLGEAFLFSDKLDSASYYINKGIQCQDTYHIYDLKAVFISDMGALETKKGNKAAALKYCREAEKDWLEAQDRINLDLIYFSYAKIYQKFRQPDSAVYYAQKALSSAIEGNYFADEAQASRLLYDLYDAQHNTPLAYKYYKMATRINDSIINKDKVRELASLDFEQKQHQDELAAAKLAYQNTIRSYLFAAGLAVLALLVLIFWRNARQRSKANKLLQEQKEEIEATLDQLKSAQNQLIQSEKMASLGELTAGIAHEIQNPLNFVNNFSEVNTELIDEMDEEIDKANLQEVKAIAADIKANLQKISHHGKRADFIVKGMLQHSRASTGEKQLTNINVLADEFLKLSYHGLRAKDKNFNAELITHFDQSLPTVNIVQQDIGRVLLNLFNNAFYAVAQKAKTAGPNYKPTVEVSTFTPPPGGGGWGVSVRDNGLGIPDAIKDKIMQPFFTTKPTGEGTGLGLSLSYDIVVKGHGGTIAVETKEGLYTDFTVTLPLT
jgi:signal transduction histidine kinase